MNFRAHLRLNSEVHRRWKMESRIGGLLCGVWFSLVDGLYQSPDPLPHEHLEALMHHSMVQLVLSTHPVGEVAPVDEPPPPRRRGRPPKNV